MIKIRFLISGNFDVENKAQHFEKGDEISVSEKEANQFIKDLIAERVEKLPTKAKK
jgi:hypothetical protein